MYGQRKAIRSPTIAVGSTKHVVNNQSLKNSSQDIQLELDSQLNDDCSSDNDDLEEYGDMHRLVLQGVMAAGYLDAKGVKKLFQESCKYLKCKVPPAEHQSPPYIQKVVREINERIKIYDMMIRSATCEITGEKYYVFLVTIERPIMKLQTYFTKMELDLFQKILESLLRKHKNFAISMTECINIVDVQDSRTFSKVNAEDFVDKMITMNYFTKVFKDKSEEDYEITLGFRTIREFEPIFREVYSDIFANCCLCKMILLNGLQCPKCPVVVHRACLKKYIKSCKVCISCKGCWLTEDALPVRTRDGAVDSSSSQHSSHNASSHTGESSQHKVSRSKDTSLDDVDMPVLEPVISPRTARSDHGSKQSKKTRDVVISSTTTLSSKEISISKNRRKSSIPKRKKIIECSSDSE